MPCSMLTPAKFLLVSPVAREREKSILFKSDDLPTPVLPANALILSFKSDFTSSEPLPVLLSQTMVLNPALL